MQTKPKTPASIKRELFTIRLPRHLADSIKVQARRDGLNVSRWTESKLKDALANKGAND